MFQRINRLGTPVKFTLSHTSAALLAELFDEAIERLSKDTNIGDFRTAQDLGKVNRSLKKELIAQEENI